MLDNRWSRIAKYDVIRVSSGVLSGFSRVEVGNHLRSHIICFCECSTWNVVPGAKTRPKTTKALPVVSSVNPWHGEDRKHQGASGLFARFPPADRFSPQRVPRGTFPRFALLNSSAPLIGIAFRKRWRYSSSISGSPGLKWQESSQ